MIARDKSLYQSLDAALVKECFCNPSSLGVTHPYRQVRTQEASLITTVKDLSVCLNSAKSLTPQQFVQCVG